MYAVTYKRNFGPEQLKDLSDMVDVHHRTFLLSEGDRRTESLRLLRGYAAEFLYQVSHMQKFRLLETERVLSQSVATIPGFEPREASIAFEDLAKYAHNLLDQPWRKEFYRLKISSGFFIHNIRAHLQNPQEILIAIGYVSIDDQTMILARPIDPVILAAVSRDCFIASQECLILSQIWERVLTEIPDCSLTIREAYEARKVLMGDTTTIVTSLVHQAHQKQHQIREKIERRGALQRTFESQSYIEPRVTKHGFVPVDRLIDVVDSGGSDMAPELESLNLIGNTRRPNGYQKKLYSINAQNPLPSADVQIQSTLGYRHDSTSTSTSSPRSPSSCNSLKELQEVFYQSFIDNSKEPQRSNSSEINELLEKHKQTVTQVDTIKQLNRRSTSTRNSHPQQMRGRNTELGGGSAPIAVADSSPVDDYYTLHDTEGTLPSSSQNHYNSRTSLSSTSAFKGLKHHQDLPKSAAASSNSSTTSTNGGLLGRFKGKVSKYEKSVVDTSSEKEFKKPLALMKSKISNDFDIDSVETRGSGILDKTGKQSSSIPLEKLFQVDQDGEERTSPVPSERNLDTSIPYRNGAIDSYQMSTTTKQKLTSPWACPHCTYVNEIALNICEICSKSKDFVL